MNFFRLYLQRFEGYSRLCLGQKCGINYATGELREKINQTENETILLIDAGDALNSLHRNLTFARIGKICPGIITALWNFKTSINLYVCANQVVLYKYEVSIESPDKRN